MITKRLSGVYIAVITAVAVLMAFAGVQFAFAGHNGAVVTTDISTCSPTTVNATIADPDGTHIVGNMFLTVDTEDDAEQFVSIPTDGSTTSISVGPFAQDTTVYWNVFGGGERDYDQPLWNGYGGADFSSDIADYAADQGGFSWVLDGTDEPNPFVNWNEFTVPGCSPEVKDECKKGGWMDYGFKNQGQCIKFVNTGMDSR